MIQWSPSKSLKFAKYLPFRFLLFHILSMISICQFSVFVHPYLSPSNLISKPQIGAWFWKSINQNPTIFIFLINLLFSIINMNCYKPWCLFAWTFNFSVHNQSMYWLIQFVLHALIRQNWYHLYHSTQPLQSLFHGHRLHHLVDEESLHYAEVFYNCKLIM